MSGLVRHSRVLREQRLQLVEEPSPCFCYPTESNAIMVFQLKPTRVVAKRCAVVARAKQQKRCASARMRQKSTRQRTLHVCSLTRCFGTLVVVAVVSGCWSPALHPLRSRSSQDVLTTTTSSANTTQRCQRRAEVNGKVDVYIMYLIVLSPSRRWLRDRSTHVDLLPDLGSFPRHSDAAGCTRNSTYVEQWV